MSILEAITLTYISSRGVTTSLSCQPTCLFSFVSNVKSDLQAIKKANWLNRGLAGEIFVCKEKKKARNKQISQGCHEVILFPPHTPVALA